MNGKITIHDIARELNITASTVSRALNNHPGISTATKDSVLKTAGKLNYRHNRVASSLRSGRTKILGVLIPSAEINFFGSVVHGIEKIANENGYSVLLYQSNEDPEYERKGVETFLRSRVEGVLASIAKETVNLEHFNEIKKRNIPLVLFDRANDDMGVSSVVIDDYKGAFRATEHLISQGYKRIAHIAGQQHVSIWHQRLLGYADALRRNGFPVDEDLIQYGKVTIESGRQCMDNFLKLPSVPDAVFAVEDFTALGAIQSLKAAGISIPAEMGVIGFANEAFSEYITPSLSTVDQQTIKMGEEAAKLFFKMSAGDKEFSVPYKHVLEPLLIFRESSLRNNRP